jgi:hypothetical protein
MNSIAILVTGQPRGLHTIGRVWAEYIRRMISYTPNSNIKVFISTSNREQVIFEGPYKEYNRNYYYNNYELKDYLYYDKISITKPEDLDSKVEEYFSELPSSLGNIGIGSSYYQFWHLQNAYNMALEYEEENNIKFDLFFKLRLDTIPLNVIYDYVEWKDDFQYLNEIINQARDKDIDSYVIGAYTPFLNVMAEHEWCNFDKNYETLEKLWTFEDIEKCVYMADVYYMLSRKAMKKLIDNLPTYLQLSTETTFLTKTINWVYNKFFHKNDVSGLRWEDIVGKRIDFVKSIDYDFFKTSKNAYEKYKLEYLDNTGDYFIQKKSTTNFVGTKYEFFDEILGKEEGVLGIIHPWDYIEHTTSIMMKCCADKIVRWPGKNFVIFRNGLPSQIEEFLTNYNLDNLETATEEEFKNICVGLKDLHKKAVLTYDKGYQWNLRKAKKNE